MTIWPGWKTSFAGTASPSAAAWRRTAGAAKYSARHARESEDHRQQRAGAAGAAQRPDMYRSALAPLAWWVWVSFAAANLIDLAVQGRDRSP